MYETPQARLDLLKLEIGIIAGKAKDAVDNLWRIRVYTYTFWFACVGAGLAGLNFKENPGIIWPLVWLSFLPPMVAAFVDATYHGWYRLLILRETEIGKFLNNADYKLPNKTAFVTDSSCTDKIQNFPVFDLGASVTYGREHKRWRWENSAIRSLASLTPLLVYASQLPTIFVPGM